MIHPLFLFMRWLQTLPVALLVFAPFEDKDLRWDRRKGYGATVLFAVLGSVLLAFLSPLFSQGGERNLCARDLTLAAMAVVFFYGCSRLVRVRTVRKLLVVVILLHYVLALQALSLVFTALILGERYPADVNAEAGSLVLDLCLLASTAITWPLTCFFFRHTLRKNLPALDNRQISRGLGYLCVMLLLFLVAIYNPRYDLWPEVPLFVAALILSDMITYYIFFQEIGAVRRQAETARQLADYQNQYQRIIGQMEGVRRLRHDIRHHLNLLGTLNAQGRSKEIALYLEKYGKVYEQLDQEKFSGDPAVDSVLSYYRTQAAEEGFPLTLEVLLRGRSGVEPMDMTVLLGNCLENALDAVRLLPKEDRRLTVTLQPSGAMLLLQVVNACGPGEDSGGFAGWEAFPSGKKAGRMGLGLRSVSEIAEKYGGRARFQRKGGEFTVQVSLCVQEEE